MKNPWKYNWIFFKIMCVVALFITGYLYYTVRSAGPLNLLQYAMLPILYGMFAMMGYGFSYMSRTIFHRKVDNPVKPEELVNGQEYWLNGETWATYVGRSWLNFDGTPESNSKDFTDNSTRYYFYIWDVNWGHNSISESTPLSRWDLRYISKNQEVK